MPIYEYQCKDCHHKFDLLQKLSEEPTKQCPECLKDTAIRLISAAGFQLKGTGWYATDFKDKGKAPQKSESDVGQSTLSSSSTDTLPAAKKTTESTTTSTTTSSVPTKGEKD